MSMPLLSLLLTNFGVLDCIEDDGDGSLFELLLRPRKSSFDLNYISSLSFLNNFKLPFISVPCALWISLFYESERYTECFELES